MAALEGFWPHAVISIICFLPVGKMEDWISYKYAWNIRKKNNDLQPCDYSEILISYCYK